jgi:hypothetical protein
VNFDLPSFSESNWRIRAARCLNFVLAHPDFATGVRPNVNAFAHPPDASIVLAINAKLNVFRANGQRHWTRWLVDTLR